MKNARKTAERLWKERYGDVKFAKDFHGNYMWYDAYGNQNYYRYFNGEKIYCGWNIHHVFPKSKGGSNDDDNLECTNIVTNTLIADKITYNLDGVIYRVKKQSGRYAICREDKDEI